jgi:CheY-like chemotaxis protein
LKLEPMDVCEVARFGLDTIRPTALAKGVRLESDIPRAPCVISGDPARLQQVMWNLLSNAAKFTPAGGTVTLMVRQSASHVTIEVRDTGIGIAADFQPYLFDRFSQADSTTTRVHRGLGLGLALVRHIVEIHGGEVEARSAGEGTGSTFVVRLPAQVGELLKSGSAPSVTEEGREDGSTDGPDLRAVTVLVVDDDDEARELFVTILEGQGARVHRAASAEEAMQRIAHRTTDVMIVDLGLPGEDGFTLLRRIRAHEQALRLPQAPAIAVTARAAAIDHQEALRAGFAAHVPKPVLPDEILSAIAQIRRSPESYG